MTVPRRRALLLLALVGLAGVGAWAWTTWGGAHPRRVVVVALDGADWQLLDRYVAAGSMPELGRLVREGRSGALRTLVPALSPLVWTTVVTGRSPLEHGILDFTRFNPKSGAREPITSDERRAKAVWEMAGDQQRRVAVLGLWATHPAEPVRGLMVSDRLFSFHRREASAPSGTVHPAGEEARVLAARAEAEQQVGLAALQAYLPWLDAAEYEALVATPDPYSRPVTALRRILVETRLYHRLATDWVRRERPDLAFVYVQGTDTIGHVFAPFAPPRQAAVTEQEFARYAEVPERYFREVDRMLGEYRRLAEETGATLLVVSDHGFLWGEGRPARPDSLAAATAGLWHREDGIYLLWGPGIAPEAARGNGRVAQVAATVLALLGLPRGSGLDSPALGGVAEDARLVDYGPRAAAAAADVDPATAEALEKLRALGYVGTAEPTTGGSRETGTRTAGSFNNEGLLLEQAGRWDEARRAYETALKVDPRSASAKHNLSEWLLKRSPGEAALADSLLLEALGDGLGDGPGILLATASSHWRAGDKARATRLIDGAIERLPADPGLRLARGVARLQARDCAGAAADLEVVHRALPGNATAQGFAGTAFLCVGRRADARAAFEASLRANPDQPELRRRMETEFR